MRLRLCVLCLALALCTAVASAQQSDDSTQLYRRKYTQEEILGAFANAVIWILSAISGILLLASMGAACELPYPAFCCYSTPFSDAAGCGRRRCHACFNIRQANLMMVACWTVALMVYFVAGRRAHILIAFASFTMGHLLVALLVHWQLKMVGVTEELDGMQLAQQQQQPHQAPSSSSMHKYDIPIQQGELVMVIQPDYQGPHDCTDWQQLSKASSGISYALRVYAHVDEQQQQQQMEQPQAADGITEEVVILDQAGNGAATTAGEQHVPPVRRTPQACQVQGQGQGQSQG